MQPSSRIRWTSLRVVPTDVNVKFDALSLVLWFLETRLCFLGFPNDNCTQRKLYFYSEVVERARGHIHARVSGGIVSVLSAAIVLVRFRATCYFPVPIVRFICSTRHDYCGERKRGR